jgi:hypothetical protein
MTLHGLLISFAMETMPVVWATATKSVDKLRLYAVPLSRRGSFQALLHVPD